MGAASGRDQSWVIDGSYSFDTNPRGNLLHNSESWRGPVWNTNDTNLKHWARLTLWAHKRCYAESAGRSSSTSST